MSMHPNLIHRRAVAGIPIDGESMPVGMLDCLDKG